MCQAYHDCDKRFTGIEKSLAVIDSKIEIATKNEKRINEVEKKVFNGYGTSINNIEKEVSGLSKDIKNTRNLIFTMLILIVVGFVGSSFVQSRSNALVQKQVIERVEEVQDAVGD